MCSRDHDSQTKPDDGEGLIASGEAETDETDRRAEHGDHRERLSNCSSRQNVFARQSVCDPGHGNGEEEQQQIWES